MDLYILILVSCIIPLVILTAVILIVFIVLKKKGIKLKNIFKPDNLQTINFNNLETKQQMPPNWKPFNHSLRKQQRASASEYNLPLTQSDKQNFDARLKYLVNRLGRRDNIFNISYETHQKLCKNHFDKTAVQALTNEITIFLGIPAILIDKITLRKIQTQREDFPGRFTKAGFTEKIDLNLIVDYTLQQIIYIICHECTHSFLFRKRLWFSNNDENEVFTEIASVYLGFGKYLKEGCKRIQKDLMFYTLGYITPNEVEYLRKALTPHMTP